ncbi:MAG: hypothetical protein BFD77_10970 [Pseudomonas sp. CO183]|nr:MAG: hypothetical protein BFD77_10970 [Pseudomonas sp. CO183]
MGSQLLKTPAALSPGQPTKGPIFLPVNLNLQAARRGLGAGRFAQVRQVGGAAAGAAKKAKVPTFAVGLPQRLGHLLAKGLKNARSLRVQSPKFALARSATLASGLGPTPGARFLFGPFLSEKPLPPEKAPGFK